MFPTVQHPHWQPILAGKGKIWKILIDASVPCLLVECRNEAAWETTFAAYDLATQTWFWDDLSFEDGWWMSLADVGDGMAYFARVSDEPLKGSPGITAVAVRRKELAWFDADWELQAAVKGGALASRTVEGEREIGLLDAQTGTLVKDASVSISPSPYQLPFHYQEGTDHFQTVAQFVREKWGVESIKVIGYLEEKQSVLISIYSKNQDNLTNHLLVMDRAGRLLHTECLGSGLRGTGSEPFLVYQHTLFYVSQNNSLSAIQLVN